MEVHWHLPALLQISQHEGGTVSKRTANKKLTKLYWPSRNRSPRRLIVLVQPKMWSGTTKKIPTLCAWHVHPNFQIRCGAIVSSYMLQTLNARIRQVRSTRQRANDQQIQVRRCLSESSDIIGLFQNKNRRLKNSDLIVNAPSVCNWLSLAQLASSFRLQFHHFVPVLCEFHF